MKPLIRGLKQTLGPIVRGSLGGLGIEPLLALRQQSSRVESHDEFLSHHRPWFPSAPRRSLDLGCGYAPLNPFGAIQAEGIDLVADPSRAVLAADLFHQTIPLGDGSIDVVTAHQFLEHVPRVALLEGTTRLPFIELMNDIHRVLIPGGLLFSATPAFPFPAALQDPTHVNIITEETFPRYFCQQTDSGPWARRYGFQGKFDLVGQAWCGWTLLTLMRKV
jgi:SAM-dependent methyltransferase